MTQQMKYAHKIVSPSNGKTEIEICNNISKRQYRSQIGIISEVLGAAIDGGRDGAIISSIAREANLSYYSAAEKCQELIVAGLVESTSNNKAHTFVATEAGIRFFQELQQFIEITKSMKIRF